MRSLKSFLWTFLSLTAITTAATAQVAVLGSPGGGAPWNNDVQAKLAGSGVALGPVTVIDISTTTPTLAQLLTYRAVLVYSDGPGYANATALGNNLHDYVDQGGGVVVGTFTNSTIPLAGTWAASQYDPILGAGQTTALNLQLGTRFLPAHPLFNISPVGSFDGGTASYHGTGGLAPSSTRIADYTNGDIFAAERDGLAGRVISLNFYPPSSTARPDFWVAGTDGDNLMANALFYAAGRRGIAVIGSPSGGSTWNDDVKAKLLASGVPLGPISIVDPSTVTPTLAELNAYRAVLVYNDFAFLDAITLGNNLHDYVDNGGGVVVATFVNASIPLGGTWISAGYDAITPTGQTQGTQVQLGARIVPGHPLFSISGVGSFDGGSSSYHGTGGLAPNSTRLAAWTNGDILAAERNGLAGRALSLNFYPPSSDVRPDFWSSATDGDNLMANALAYAGATPRVAVLGAPGSPTWSDDVKAKIVGSGALQAAVTIIDIQNTTPTLAELKGFRSVLVFSDFNFQDPNVLGNNLHDYANGGGGVVTCTFNNCFYPLGGTWSSGAYDPITFGGFAAGSAVQLGVRLVPAHPLFTASPVVSFDGGTSSYHSLGALAAASTRLANYTDGSIFAAERNGLGGRVIGLNFYPPSSDSRADFWVATTDGDNVMANALSYTGGFATYSATYCNAKLNSLGCIPRASSNGISSATATAGFVLRCIQVRNAKPGLAIYSSNGRSSAPFQGGTLCVNSPVRRSVPLSSGGTPLPINDCSGVYGIDMNAFSHGLLGGTPSGALLIVGQVIDCQFWGRDPGFTPPNNSTLSDALEYVVAP